MRIELLKSKLHRIVVTDTNLNYNGSIGIDENLMEKANLLEYEKVDVFNVNNGERFTTYAIKGKKNSGEICIYGAASRKVMNGDILILVSYASFTLEEAKNFKPTVLKFEGDTNLKFKIE